MIADRLLRRATEPGGVIDLREPQRKYERAADWGARHLSVASSVWQRYLPGVEPGGDAGLPFASHGTPPVAAVPSERAAPASAPSSTMAASASAALPTSTTEARPVDPGPAIPARSATPAGHAAAAPSTVTRIVGPAIRRRAVATPPRQALPLAAASGSDLPAPSPTRDGAEESKGTNAMRQVPGALASAAAYAPGPGTSSHAPESAASLVAPPAAKTVHADPTTARGRVVQRQARPALSGSAPISASAPLLVQRKAAGSPEAATAWRRAGASATLLPVAAATTVRAQPAQSHGRMGQQPAPDTVSASRSDPVLPAASFEPAIVAAPPLVQRKAVASPPPDMVWRRESMPTVPFAIPWASSLHAVPALPPGPVVQRQVQDAGKESASAAASKPAVAPVAARPAPPVPDMVDQVMRKVLRQLAVEQERRGGGRWR